MIIGKSGTADNWQKAVLAFLISFSYIDELLGKKSIVYSQWPL